MKIKNYFIPTTVIASLFAYYMLGPMRQKSDSKEISFAVILSNESDEDFLSGINLALDEVNASGGVLGKTLNIKIYRENVYASPDQQTGLIPAAMNMATDIAKDQSIVAGISDSNGAALLPEASVFDNLKKLLVATSSASTTLTNIGLRYVFAMQLSQEDIATALAHYAYENNLTRFVVIGDNSLPSVNIGRRFQSKLAERSSGVLFNTNLPSYSHDQIERTILYIKDNNTFSSTDIDAFFFSASRSIDYMWFIKRIRELGFHQPVFGPANMISSDLERIVGKVNMTNLTSVSISHDPIGEEQHLPKSIHPNQSISPYSKSISAFDSIKLLSYAINTTKSLDSTVLANFIRSMRYIKPFHSYSGDIAFDATGRITDCNVSIISHDGNSFVRVAQYTKPFSWTQPRKGYSHSILQPSNNQDW